MIIIDMGYDRMENSKLWVKLSNLESGISVAPWINVASGKFDKKNKCRPLKYANLGRKI